MSNSRSRYAPSIFRDQLVSDTIDPQFTYLHNAHHGALGLHGHAMFLSLPPVLLVWGIIAFAIGFIAYTAQDLVVGDSNKGQWDAAWIALSISFFVLLVVGLSLYTLGGMWKTGRDWFRRNVVRAGHPSV